MVRWGVVRARLERTVCRGDPCFDGVTMTDSPLTLSHIKRAIEEGRTHELHLQRVELVAGPDCVLNCGGPKTQSVRATSVESWLNHNESALVLDLRQVSFETAEGTKHRTEAFAYVRADPPTPKPSEE